MHEHGVNAFFCTCLREISKISSRQQREQAIAYFSGFLCHYIADSICHPYIYGRIQKEGEGKGMHVHGLHAELENDIDALLLLKFKKKKPSEFNQTATICLNGQELQFVSRFLSQCINKTYYPITEKNNFQVSEGMVFRSVYAIRFGGRLLSDPSGYKQSAVRTVERMIFLHPVASKKLVTDQKPQNVRKVLNLDHEIWVNPWDNRLASSASFVDLYHRTLQKCSLVYYFLNTLLAEEFPTDESLWNPLLTELGNDSYHSGLDVG